MENVDLTAKTSAADIEISADKIDMSCHTVSSITDIVTDSTIAKTTKTVSETTTKKSFEDDLSIKLTIPSISKQKETTSHETELQDLFENETTIHPAATTFDIPSTLPVSPKTPKAPKSSSNTLPTSQFVPSQNPLVCWAKLSGFPYWPSLIINDHAFLPPLVIAEKHTKDQTAVLFFGEYSYGWINAQDIKPYTEENYKKYFKKKGSANMRIGCDEAADEELFNSNWEKFLLREAKKTQEKETERKGKKEKVEKRKSIAAEEKAQKKRKVEVADNLVPEIHPLLRLRAKIQKFLQDETLPKTLKEHSKCLEALKILQDVEVTIDLLRDTKIGKVVRKCSIFTGFPVKAKKDGETKSEVENNEEKECQDIVEKIQALGKIILDKWRKIVDENGVDKEKNDKENVDSQKESNIGDKEMVVGELSTAAFDDKVTSICEKAVADNEKAHPVSETMLITKEAAQILVEGNESISIEKSTDMVKETLENTDELAVTNSAPLDTALLKT